MKVRLTTLAHWAFHDLRRSERLNHLLAQPVQLCTPTHSRVKDFRCGYRCQCTLRRYSDQMQVIAHMILANLQEHVQLLLCDPDEYLALASPASLADMFNDCLQVGSRQV